MNKVYLDIPYNEKDSIKSASTNVIRWDAARKKWFVELETDELIDNSLRKYIMTYIQVPFCKKDDVKANGGKWDSVVKCWYWLTDANHYFANQNFKHRNL